MRCIVGSKNPVKIGAAREAISRCMEQPFDSVVGIDVPSGVAAQPMSEAETRSGAVNRVKACIEQSAAGSASDTWYVALEGGVDEFEDGPATFAYVAICHQGQWSVGRSANLPLPEPFYRALKNGQELGDVMDEAFKTHNIKQKGGAIGLLTNHLATRQSVYELALTLAMAKFMHPDLYPQEKHPC
ncbi:non-canonical purine NTP phosphatase [Alteromonas aestuariivivens]|uniref:Inosine/xanthosine triphosphatase n=1 Tax=Alteromonas aestuariivivens TaxID=1938339 RepID=A0A3D8M5L3_9ALTE|nr:inosine/xanthosine triphosphatase [Alteromonas aestuariivivens]RDV24870.1 non-canonical purine NTP phosphatase [Alteromonas aestuariivivens]